jgi:Family of unknown function (DUF6335)
MTMAKKSARRPGRGKASARPPARSRRVAKVARRAATKARAKGTKAKGTKTTGTKAAKAKRTVARSTTRTSSKTPSTRSKPTPKTPKPRPEPIASSSGRQPRLDRARRTLDDVVPTPPSSLDLDRRGSAARTGRAELQDSIKEHAGMTPALTAGDVDANWENAYFSGDEAPGGDNPTPDQEVVDEIGKALGVEYQDNEELRGSDKVVERDKHRWELDPASSEDFRDRK